MGGSKLRPARWSPKTNWVIASNIGGTATLIGDQRAFVLAIEEGTTQPIRRRLRHNLNKANECRHQKENADNGKNTQNNGKPMTAVASRRMNHT